MKDSVIKQFEDIKDIMAETVELLKKEKENIYNKNCQINYYDKNAQTDITVNKNQFIMPFSKIKLDKNRKYIPRKLVKNDTNIIEVNTWYKWIDFSNYVIGTTVIAQKKGWDNKTIIIGNFCNNCRKPTNTSDNYCIECYNDMSGKSDRPGLGTYNGKHNKCNNCCNLFLYNNKDDEYCDKCIINYCENCHIIEEELKQYKNLDNKNIVMDNRYIKESIKNKLKKVEKGREFIINGKKMKFKGVVYNHTEEIKCFRNDINTYQNKIKKNLDRIKNFKKKYTFLDKKYNEDYFKNIKEEINFKHEDFNIFINNKQKERKEFTNNFKIIYDSANKELDKLILLENVYIKLTSNNTNMDIFDIFDKDFPLYDNIEELRNNKLEKYTKMSNLGNILYNNNLNKDDLKRINSINPKTRPARYIQKYKRIYLLEKYIDINKIALSNIGNWIRDKSDSMFYLLIDMLKNKCVLTGMLNNV